MALLSQGVGHNLGHLNPPLYSEIGPAQILRRITEGNNGTTTLAGFSSRPGWNAVAGWGTPDGQKLLDWRRAHPSALRYKGKGTVLQEAAALWITFA